MKTETTSSSNLPGFEEVSVENLSEVTLTAEDLESSKKQLWLIKVPYEVICCEGNHPENMFDVSTLSGTTVILNGTQELPLQKSEKDAGRRYETRASKYLDKESCPFNVVVPSRKGNCLKVAKGFSGHLDIVQTVKVPMLVYPPTPPPMYRDIPKGLRARWKPFGYRAPRAVSRKDEEARINVRKGESLGEHKKHKLHEKRRKRLTEEDNVREKGSPKKKKKNKEREDV